MPAYVLTSQLAVDLIDRMGKDNALFAKNDALRQALLVSDAPLNKKGQLPCGELLDELGIPRLAYSKAMLSFGKIADIPSWSEDSPLQRAYPEAVEAFRRLMLPIDLQWGTERCERCIVSGGTCVRDRYCFDNTPSITAVLKTGCRVSKGAAEPCWATTPTTARSRVMTMILHSLFAVIMEKTLMARGVGVCSEGKCWHEGCSTILPLVKHALLCPGLGRGGICTRPHGEFCGQIREVILHMMSCKDEACADCASALAFFPASGNRHRLHAPTRKKPEVWMAAELVLLAIDTRGKKDPAARGPAEKYYRRVLHYLKESGRLDAIRYTPSSRHFRGAIDLNLHALRRYCGTVTPYTLERPEFRKEAMLRRALVDIWGRRGDDTQDLLRLARTMILESPELVVTKENAKSHLERAFASVRDFVHLKEAAQRKEAEAEAEA